MIPEAHTLGAVPDGSFQMDGQPVVDGLGNRICPEPSTSRTWLQCTLPSLASGCFCCHVTDAESIERGDMIERAAMLLVDERSPRQNVPYAPTASVPPNSSPNLSSQQMSASGNMFSADRNLLPAQRASSYELHSGGRGFHAVPEGSSTYSISSPLPAEGAPTPTPSGRGLRSRENTTTASPDRDKAYLPAGSKVEDSLLAFIATAPSSAIDYFEGGYSESEDSRAVHSVDKAWSERPTTSSQESLTAVVRGERNLGPPLHVLTPVLRDVKSSPKGQDAQHRCQESSSLRSDLFRGSDKSVGTIDVKALVEDIKILECDEGARPPREAPIVPAIDMSSLSRNPVSDLPNGSHDLYEVQPGSVFMQRGQSPATFDHPSRSSLPALFQEAYRLPPVERSIEDLSNEFNDRENVYKVQGLHPLPAQGLGGNAARSSPLSGTVGSAGIPRSRSLTIRDRRHRTCPAPCCGCLAFVQKYMSRNSSSGDAIPIGRLWQLQENAGFSPDSLSRMQSWTRRDFFFKERQHELAITYGVGREVRTACLLICRDGAATIVEVDPVDLQPPNPAALRWCEDQAGRHLDSAAQADESALAELAAAGRLYPFAIFWTDAAGQKRTLVLAAYQRQARTDCLVAIRSRIASIPNTPRTDVNMECLADARIDGRSPSMDAYMLPEDLPYGQIDGRHELRSASEDTDRTNQSEINYMCARDMFLPLDTTLEFIAKFLEGQHIESSQANAEMRSIILYHVDATLQWKCVPRSPEEVDAKVDELNDLMGKIVEILQEKPTSQTV